MEQKRCAKCGEAYAADFDGCPQCAQAPVVVVKPEKKLNPYGIASLALGIVAPFVYLSFEWAAYLAIILGIFGIARARHYNGGGLATSIIGLILGVLTTAIVSGLLVASL